jgi:hypothetical protein
MGATAFAKKQLSNSLTFANNPLGITTFAVGTWGTYVWAMYTYFWWQIRSFEADPFLVARQPTQQFRWYVPGSKEDWLTSLQLRSAGVKGDNMRPFLRHPMERGLWWTSVYFTPKWILLQCTVKLWPWWS